MKKLIIKKCFCIAFTLLGIGISMQAQDREFTIKYPNGKIYREGKFIASTCGRVLQETTFDVNGDLIRQEQWRNRKRCGTTKVYFNGKLQKEIVYRDNLMVSYVAYRSGLVYTRISENRNIIINKGREVVIRWQRYYTKFGQQKLLVLTKKELVDAMRYFMLPEEITQTLADITNNVDLTPVPGGNAALTCGGKTQAINDANADFKSTDPQKKQDAANVGGMIGNTCSAIAAASLTGSFSGATGDAARKGRIDRASSALDKAISNCESNPSNTSSGGMFSAEPEASSGAVIAMHALYKAAYDGTLSAATRNAAMAAADDLAVIIADANITTWTTETAYTVVAGTGGRAILLGSALPEVLAVVAAGLAVASVVEAVVTTTGTDNTNGGTTGGGSGESEGAVQTPVPDEMNSGNACERLKALKKYCESTHWQGEKCENAARLFSGCGGDLREMYVAGDGDLSGIGCPSPMSPEEVARRNCQSLGMRAMPVSGNSVCRSTGNLDGAIPNPGIDPTIVNPTRGDFSINFKNTSIKVLGSQKDLERVLINTSRPTMVVFMNPDCPSCQNFTQSLKTKEVATMMENIKMDVVVLDASALPEVMSTNNITAFPSYFVFKDGKKSAMTVGAMPGIETVNFMNKFK
ncbi:MAG: hypothetical protein IPP72_11985 [Chitinophagaceae bacterium]|nr:hypothetical protein [Chitinophagaceae bacterium]